jgi:anti-sigma factor RsiW
VIQAYVDGSATGSERRRVEAHLSGCPQCAALLRRSRQLVQALASMPARPVSDQFEARLQAAMREQPRQPSARGTWERFFLHFEWRLRVPALATAGVLASALLAAGLLPVLHQDDADEGRYVEIALNRYQQLQHRMDADETLDASIALSTGSVVIE